MNGFANPNEEIEFVEFYPFAYLLCTLPVCSSSCHLHFFIFPFLTVYQQLFCSTFIDQSALKVYAMAKSKKAVKKGKVASKKVTKKFKKVVKRKYRTADAGRGILHDTDDDVQLVERLVLKQLGAKLKKNFPKKNFG